MLVRLKPRPKDAGGELAADQGATTRRSASGADAAVLEKTRRCATPARKAKAARKPRRSQRAQVGAQRPRTSRLCRARCAARCPPSRRRNLPRWSMSRRTDDDWLSEIKFDGYRLLAFKDGDAGAADDAQRPGLDQPAAGGRRARLAGCDVEPAVLDGELVALREDGVSGFRACCRRRCRTAATQTLYFYVFDLLHLDGWDLRPLPAAWIASGCCRVWRLAGRAALQRSSCRATPTAMRREACRLHLEGIICKRPTRRIAPAAVKQLGEGEVPGARGTGGARLDAAGRQPHGPRRAASGLLRRRAARCIRRRRRQRVFRTRAGGAARAARYAGGGTAPPACWWPAIRSTAPMQLGEAGAGRGGAVHRLVGRRAGCATRCISACARTRRRDEVVRPVADPEAARAPFAPQARRRSRIVTASPPSPPTQTASGGQRDAAVRPRRGIVVAQGAETARSRSASVTLTHPDRELWPGITKRDLAEYWLAVADQALPEIAATGRSRWCAVPRASTASTSSRSTAKPGFPQDLRRRAADGAPYLAIDDMAGLLAMAQMSAIELHAWGATASRSAAPGSPGVRPRSGRGRRVRRGRRRCARRARSAEDGWAWRRSAAPRAARACMSSSRWSPRADWDDARSGAVRFAETMAAEAVRTAIVSHLPKVADGAGASWWIGCATASARPRSRRFRRGRGRAPASRRG